MSGGNKEDVACGHYGHFPNAIPSTALQQGFGKFYRCTKFSDITLVDADRKKINAHRLVLCAGSKRFDELLQQEKVLEGGEISCTDIDPSCLHAMLKFLYTANCEIQVHNAVKLLAAAILYGCHDLESMSNLYIHIQLNPSTCCFFFSEAQKYRIDHISKKCIYIASLDFNSVMRTAAFFNLSVEDLMTLLGSPKMASVPKLLLYKAGCAWMMQDVSRLGKFKDVLLCIQMGGQSVEELENFFNPTQGSDGQQLNYPDPATLESTQRPVDHGPELSRTASAQTTIPASRLPTSQSLRSSNFDGRLNNVASVASNVKSDCASNTHLETTEPSRAAPINVTLYPEQISLSPKQGNCQCPTLRNVEAMMSSTSVQSDKLQSGEDHSPTSETSVVQKSRMTRPRTGSTKAKKGQPHRCQVDGCTNDLQELKEYHNRYKICSQHLKMNYIMKDGHQQRFCQQCGRFHLLEEFDNKKRSCRARLQRHNERRRKRLKNGSKVSKQGPFISFPSNGIPSSHLLYLSQVNPLRTGDTQTTNMESCFPNDKTLAARCIQLVPTEMDRCFMLSPVNPTAEQTNMTEKSAVVTKRSLESDSTHVSAHRDQSHQ